MLNSDSENDSTPNPLATLLASTSNQTTTTKSEISKNNETTIALHIVLFSKDRPFQLSQTLSTLNQFIINVIYYYNFEFFS